MSQLETQNEELLSIIDFLRSEVKKLRGRQYALEKHAQDDTGDTNEEQPSPQHQAPAVFSTAHLARRLRGF